jgi:hypothetical protein
MKDCDTLLILGSTMPWFEYYPKLGQARGVQIDVKRRGGRRRWLCNADGRDDDGGRK